MNKRNLPEHIHFGREICGDLIQAEPFVDGRLVLQRNQKAVKIWSMVPRGYLKKDDNDCRRILRKERKDG